MVNQFVANMCHQDNWVNIYFTILVKSSVKRLEYLSAEVMLQKKILGIQSLVKFMTIIFPAEFYNKQFQLQNNGNSFQIFKNIFHFF